MEGLGGWGGKGENRVRGGEAWTAGKGLVLGWSWWGALGGRRGLWLATTRGETRNFSAGFPSAPPS